MHDEEGEEQSIHSPRQDEGHGDKVLTGDDGSRYQCPQCGKYFINNSVLKRHLRVHTGEKPYVCPLCNKAFSQLGNMTKHMKSHENAHLRWDRKTCSKPFKCTYPGCNKSFTAKTSLQSHLLSHENSTLLSEKKANHSNTQNVNQIHRSMISRHLRHHHYPNSIIYQDDQSASSRIEEEVIADNGANKKESTSSTADVPQPSVLPASSSPSQCLHTGCNQVFNSQHELREHLYAFSPGLLAEHQFLITTVLQFADIINEWDSKSKLEKESLRAYALSVKQAVEKMNTNMKNLNEQQSKQQQKTFDHTHEHAAESASTTFTDQAATSTASIPAYEASESVVKSAPIAYYHHDHSHDHTPFYKETLATTQTSSATYWSHDHIHPHQLKSSYYYDSLQGDLDHYFEPVANQPSATNMQSTGAYSNLLHAHNSINQAWTQHQIPVHAPHETGPSTTFYHPSPQHQQHHDPYRATMSWEEAIEKSQSMLSRGVAHPSIMINPCNSWEKYNFLDFLPDDFCATEIPDSKRQKSTHDM